MLIGCSLFKEVLRQKEKIWSKSKVSNIINISGIKGEQDENLPYESSNESQASSMERLDIDERSNK